MSPAAARSGRRRSRDRVDRHLLAVLVLELEPDDAIHQGKERVVVGPTDVLPGVELGAALAHDDAAGSHDLTTIALHAEVLGIAVPAVAARAYTLLVSHPILTRA